MSISARSRVWIIAIAFAASVGLVGCGGGGATGGAGTTAQIVPPPATSGVLPTATFDATPTQASADRLATIATAAVNSLIKTGIMYGILPTMNGVPDLVSNCMGMMWATPPALGTVASGTAIYTNCNAGAGVGVVSGTIELAYTKYTNPSDYAVDLTNVALSAPSYIPAYMGTTLNFSGTYAFDHIKSGRPYYFVEDAGSSFGKLTVIGQPVVSSNGSNMTITNPPLSAGFTPTPVIVRANIDAAGNWVELQFDKWDVETSSGKSLPASSCTPCTLTITDAKGGKATVTVTSAGSSQQMVFTPAAGVALPSLPIKF